VIEDDFCNGRPAWERVGVQMVESVAPYEEAKIRILNGTHSCIAWAGTLAGTRYIHEGLRDERIRRLAYEYVSNDVIPCLRPSPIDLEHYRDVVLERFGNAALCDTNQRVAMDAFSKIPSFILPTIRDRLARNEPVASVAMLPALFLAFLRRWHHGLLPAAYEDQAMDPAAAHAICASADPVAAFCRNTTLWAELAGDERLTAALRTASARVHQLFPEGVFSMSERLKHRHALLTGAGGGIGLAVARAYLAEGARCTVVDLATEPSPAVQALQAAHPDHLHYLSANVADVEQVEAMVAAAAERFGPVEVLFNNAAVFDLAPLLQSDEAMYERLFAVNVKGMFFVMQKVLAQMVEAGRGVVINLASQAGRRGEALVSHYCATKAAVISYTQSAALAMAPHGIRVNAISPGVIDTPMWSQVDALFARYEGLQPGEKKVAVGKAVPLGHMGRPEDIAGAAIFLASDEASYITAQTLNVDGGNVMS
jgi:NAD(P)-dependent dehydrogenase (short-subunit alcohol dehydrogenase family)